MSDNETPAAARFDLFPAIDLLDGKSVRLARGSRSSAHEVSEDPIAQIERYADWGAKWVHIVNLNAAFGDPEEHSGRRATDQVLQRLLRFSDRVRLQVGGGMRSERAVESLFDLGVHRVVIGTWALREPDRVCDLAGKHQGRVLVGLDALDGKLAAQGWTQTHGELDLYEFGKRLSDGGVQTVVYTQIEKDGMLSGVDVPAMITLSERSGLYVIASGGVRDNTDIAALCSVASKGVCGVIVGKAIHAGTIDLESALQEVQI